MREGDEAFDPGPPPREFLFRLSVVRGEPSQEVGPCNVRFEAANIVFLPLRSPVRPFVMPEIEVPSTVEVADTSPAPNLHFHTSK